MDEVNRVFVDPTIVPKRVNPGDPPRPEWRPRNYLYPCLSCNALNAQPSGWPAPESCGTCGSRDLVLGPQPRPIALEGERVERRPGRRPR